MIINALILAALCLGTIQVKQRDRYAALFFLTPVVLMNVAGRSIPGEQYYFICAVMDREVLFFLVGSGLFPELAVAAFVAVVLSFFGWGLWVSYQSPACYNLVSTLYYIWISWILFKGSAAYGGLSTLLTRVGRRCLVCIGSLQGVGRTGPREAAWTK